MREGNGVGTDVLGDAAGFACGDIGLADHVEQGGLAVIDVAHDRDHRGAGLELLGLVVNVNHDRGLGRVNLTFAFGALLDLELEPVFRAKLLRNELVDGLVDVGHHLQLDQVRDELEGFLVQLLGQVTDDDRRLERDDLRAVRQDDGGNGGTRRSTDRPALRLPWTPGKLGLSALKTIVATTAAAIEILTLPRTAKPGALWTARRRSRRWGNSLSSRTGRQLDEPDLVTHARSGWGRRRGGQRRSSFDHDRGNGSGLRLNRGTLKRCGWFDLRCGKFRCLDLDRCRRFRRCGDEDDGLGSGGRRRLYVRLGRLEKTFEILGGDFIERAGRNLRAGNAQFFGLGNDFLALDAKFLCYFVNPNGHKYSVAAGSHTRFSCALHAGDGWCCHHGQVQAGLVSSTLKERLVASSLAASSIPAAASPISGISARSLTSHCNKSSSDISP